MTILIVGGAGYIGSHVNKELNKQGYETVVLDDLSSGKKELVKWGKLYEGKLDDKLLLNKIFSENKIEAVMHFAAFKAVGESVINPEKYYLNNIASTLALLRSMREHGVNKFIFSSSAATYGVPQYVPIDEHHPTKPINTYGRSKLMVEQILGDYDKAYGFRSVALRYFNAAGADLETEVGEWPGSSSNLIPLVMEVAIGKTSEQKIFGNDFETEDGYGVRDYVHVFDLATAHIKALEFLNKEDRSEVFNLGNGEGYSVKEVIDMAREVTGKEIKTVVEGRREGDPATLIASAEKAKKILNWNPIYPDLKTIVESAWKWRLKLEEKGV